MADQFTPGPWEFGPVADERIGLYAENGYRVATVHNFNGRPMNTCNARLIAEAPAMLEALREILHATDGSNPSHIGQDQAFAIARAVIHRATGEAA